MSEVAAVTTATNTTGTSVPAPAHGSAEEVKQSITKKAESVTKDTAKKQDEPKKTYKLKSDKGDYEVSEEDYHAAAQTGFTANKRLREATAKEKAAVEAMRLANEKEEKYNNWQKLTPDQKVEQALVDLKDPSLTKTTRDKVEKWLWSQLQQDQQSPEQRELATLKAEKEEWTKNQQKQAEAAKKQKFEQDKIQHQQSAQQDVIKIVQLAGVPVTEHNFKLAADYLFINHKAKSGATPERIAQFVKDDTINSATHLYGSIADGIIKAKETGNQEEILKHGQALLDYLPAHVVKALRIVDYTRHMNGIPQTSVERAPDVAKVEQKPNNGAYEFKNMDEWIDARKKMVQDLDKSTKRA